MADQTQPLPDPDDPRRALLVGTPLTLWQAYHALEFASARLQVVGCVVNTWPQVEDDLPVKALGGVDQGPAIASEHDVDEVFICLPAACVETVQKLIAELDHRQITWRLLPTIDDQVEGRLRAALLPIAGNQIDVASLIDRQPRALDEEAIRSTIAGRVVMITGAGGSIGSELARIVGRFDPQALLLVERAENQLFEIDQQIRHIYPDLERAAVLHDVTDHARTLAMMTRYRPGVIFHAAAHKHVPMMEDHPSAAVENNFYGTRSIAEAAAATGADRFVMISTDKAVNPSSVMGATKRLAELYIQYLNARSDTTFCMVRFGNVLGSACSVLPIWSRQLAHGGPITVTDARMTRYFMTIPEAAGLVIQSAAYSDANEAGGGEVFLLDMGRPQNILQLAERFIRASGFEPQLDVPVKITGVRPGEKLFEELAYEGEGMLPTPHESIRLWQTTPPDPAQMQQIVGTFDRLRSKRGPADHHWQHASHDAIVTALRAAIPEMVPSASRAAG